MSLLIEEMLAPLSDAPGVESWPVLGLLLRATFVLLLCLAGLWFLRRTQRKRALGVVELLETQQLSSAHSVYLVRVGDRKLLLGGGTAGLSVLCELSPNEPVRETVLAEQTPLGDSWLPPARNPVGPTAGEGPQP